MNNDLISREALKEVIKANHYLLSAKNNSTDYGMFTTGIMEAIDNADPIDMTKPMTKPMTCPNCESGYAQGYSDGYLKGKEERPHGKWIYKAKIDGIGWWYCSNCLSHKEWVGCNSNYCPNCGAKMDGGAE